MMRTKRVTGVRTNRRRYAPMPLNHRAIAKEVPSRMIQRALHIPSTPPQKPNNAIRFRYEVLALTAMCLVIGLVSAYDTFLLVRFQDLIVEENPMGRWLMAADEGSVALFVGCKFAGTILVLATITFLYLFRSSMGLVVAAALSSGQLVLAWYLTFF